MYSRGGVNPGTVSALADLLLHLQALDLVVRDFSVNATACSKFTELKDLQVEAESALCFDEVMNVLFSLKLEVLKLKEVSYHVGKGVARRIRGF